MSHTNPVTLTCPSCERHQPGSPYHATWCQHCGEPMQVVDGPFRDGLIWVLNRKCTTCLFRPGNKMDLNAGVVADIVKDCIKEDRVIPCHRTLNGPRSICRGLWDLHRNDIYSLRLAQAMGVIEFDDPPEGH